MSKAGERLLKSAREAAAIARGDAEPPRIHIPSEFDVRAIRSKLRLSQDDFASEFGFSVNQIRDWEQCRSRPLGGNRAYLLLIERKPALVRQALKQLMNEDFATEYDTADERMAM